MDGLSPLKTIFSCTKCNAQGKTFKAIHKHFSSFHWDEKSDTCLVCKKQISVKKSKHIRKKHVKKVYKCSFCINTFHSINEINLHMSVKHSTPENNIFTNIESAFGRNISTFQYRFKEMEIRNFDILKQKVFEQICDLVLHQLKIKKLLRISLVVVPEYVKYDEMGGVDDTVECFLRSFSKVILLSDAKLIKKNVFDCLKETEERHDDFLGKGSGWVLNHFKMINIELGKLTFAGGCSKIKYAIPPGKAQFLSDVETEKQECFFNSIANSFLTDTVRKNLSPKQLGFLTRAITKTTFNTKNLKTPIKLDDISTFERKNRRLNLHINVFTYLDGSVIPVHKSKLEKHKRVINLFLAQCKRTKEHHYIFISDFHRFLRQQDSTKNFHCSLCLNSFSSKIALENHIMLCSKSDPVRVEYPMEGDVVEFTHFDKQVLQPVFGCCDFEASLVPVTREENGFHFNCENCVKGGPLAECSHKSTLVHHQIPTTYSILLVDKFGEILFEKTESKENNVMECFFNTLFYIEENLFPLLQKCKFKDNYTKEENDSFLKSFSCYLCHQVFNDNFRHLRKVRDHCHYSNEYLGAAHSKCNWRRSVERKIPIFVHNFKNYDAHFILQGLKHEKTKGNIDGIPLNQEKFRTLSVSNIIFVDSMQMLPASLDTLVSNLKIGKHNFPLISKHPFFSDINKKAFLLQKGVYPYEWAASITKLKETVDFPSRKDFFSILTQSSVSKEAYEHGLKIFHIFNCKTMLDYCHLYCRLDTLLLAEVMTVFRKKVYEEFHLDCTKYISVPQLSFDSMLLTLSEPIHLMTDPDMILMMEQNVRGGVSFINERHVCLKNFSKTKANETIETKIQDQLLYIDANNLYSVAQSAPLPLKNYSWCTPTDLSQIQEYVLEIPVDYTYGFILEVDIISPPHIHEKCESLPFLPYEKQINFDILSPFSQKCLETLSSKQEAKKYKSTKLVTDLLKKKKYVVHYRNLQTYIKNGAVLIKIRRGIKFIQKAYLKPFIDKCTKKRIESKDPFEKMLWKLKMNSVYGKFLQNNRSHMDVKICNKEGLFQKYFNSPVYKGHKILSANVVAVYSHKSLIKLDRLYATGFSILEISKNHMYESWYHFIQPTLGIENVSVVLTDTDSLLLHIRNMSRKEVFDRLSPCLDFSNYPKTHFRFNEKNKGIPGYFKDESAGNYMTEVIGLRSKCYITKVKSFLKGKKRQAHVVCKGVTKAAREKLTMKIFRNVITRVQSIQSNIFCIRSNKHQLFTQKISKIALSSADDKRYVKDCGKHTLPFGFEGNKDCLLCG